MSILNQTGAVIAMNVRSIPQRLWMSAATVVAVATEYPARWNRAKASFTQQRFVSQSATGATSFPSAFIC